MSINVKLGNNIINGVDVVKLQDATTEGLYHSLVEPSGNQDITSLDEYDVTSKSTARVSSTERAKIIPENIKKDVSILGVTGSFEGSVSTQSQSIFTGWTAPLTYLNSPDNVFEYKSATHNITITGLDNIATISGNGTKNVTVTIDTTSTSDRQTAFTITCSNDSQSLTYNGIAFHYGTDITNGNCLVVAQTLVNEQIGYIFIESSSLPCFSSNTTLWNNIYSYQVISFKFAKSDVTGIGGNFLYNCYSFNQPITIPSNVTSIDNYFLYGCYSFNQPITIPSNVTSIGTYFLYNCYSLIYLEYNSSVYPTDNNSLSQNRDSKTSTSGTGIKVVGTGASGLKAALPNRTSNPYRKLV